MNQKDEINALKSKINSLKYQIKQKDDYKIENQRLKKGLEEIRKKESERNKEIDQIENNISSVFTSFKSLIRKKGNEYLKIKSSYNKDILERMKKENKYFEEKIILLEGKSKALLDELYTNAKKYCSCLASGPSSENIMINIEAIKFNLQNILNEFNFVFQEIEEIINLFNQLTADKEEENLRKTQINEIITKELDRLLK